MTKETSKERTIKINKKTYKVREEDNIELPRGSTVPDRRYVIARTDFKSKAQPYGYILFKTNNKKELNDKTLAGSYLFRHDAVIDAWDDYTGKRILKTETEKEVEKNLPRREQLKQKIEQLNLLSIAESHETNTRTKERIEKCRKDLEEQILNKYGR